MACQPGTEHRRKLTRSDRSHTILVVDDDPESRALTTILLRTHGHAPVEVDSGPAAVTLIRNEVFDFILMDLEMPHMTGVEAARLIRECNAIPIFALTSNSEEHAGGLCRDAGMNGFITKPLRKMNLSVVLEIVDEMRQAARPSGLFVEHVVLPELSESLGCA